MKVEKIDKKNKMIFFALYFIPFCNDVEKREKSDLK